MESRAAKAYQKVKCSWWRGIFHHQVLGSNPFKKHQWEINNTTKPLPWLSDQISLCSHIAESCKTKPVLYRIHTAQPHQHLTKLVRTSPLPTLQEKQAPTQSPDTWTTPWGTVTLVSESVRKTKGDTWTAGTYEHQMGIKPQERKISASSTSHYSSVYTAKSTGMHAVFPLQEALISLKCCSTPEQEAASTSASSHFHMK